MMFAIKFNVIFAIKFNLIYCLVLKCAIHKINRLVCNIRILVTAIANIRGCATKGGCIIFIIFERRKYFQNFE